MAEYAFLLLGGPQKGAELNLMHDGAYKLGASLDSDIYLPVYGLNDQELMLLIARNSLSLTFVNPSVSDTFINGVHLEVSEGSTAAINPFDIIIHGSLEFCVKIMGQKTPKDLPLRLQEYQQMIAEHERQKLANSIAGSDLDDTLPATEEEDEDASEDNAYPNQTDLMHNDFTGNSNKNSKESLQPTDIHPSKGKAVWILDFLKTNKQIIIAIVIFGILAYQGIALLLQSNTQETVVESKTNLKKIEDYLQVNELSHLSIRTQDPKEIPVVEGYLKNKQEKNKIMQDFHAQQINAELKIKLTQDQINSVIDLFETYDIQGLTIEEADMMGSFVIQGYPSNTSQWDKVNRYLSRDFPDIKNLINQVETPETRKKLLEELTKKRGLFDDIQIKLDKDKIIATTFLLPIDEASWQSVIAEYNEKTGGNPAVVTKQANISWLNIMSLHIGNPSYIVLKDGKKYLEGTILSGSIKLEKITEEALILETQRGRTIYPLPKESE